ncbi:MAG TPA: hypothetical protein VGM87_24205 [Roseomonas sp.]|jgi:hypothetical protein
MLRRAALSLCVILASSAVALAQKSDPSGPSGPSGNPTFQLSNTTPNVVNNVYASPSSESNWGEDRLGANEVIAPRGTRTFNLPAGECTYDVRIVYQGDVAEERMRVNACAAGVVIMLPMAGQRLR